MKLTTYTDFGVRTLLYLAVLPDGRKSSSAEIARVYQASRNHIAKVIAHLASLGYINSSRGKSGGIWLARPPEDINIGELIRQLENTLNPNSVASSSQVPLIECKFKMALNIATNAFLITMDQFSLKDLLESKATLNDLWRINTAILSTTDRVQH